jgi:hypothetical protein
MALQTDRCKMLSGFSNRPTDIQISEIGIHFLRYRGYGSGGGRATSDTVLPQVIACVGYEVVQELLNHRVALRIALRHENEWSVITTSV